MTIRYSLFGNSNLKKKKFYFYSYYKYVKIIEARNNVNGIFLEKIKHQKFQCVQKPLVKIEDKLYSISQHKNKNKSNHFESTSNIVL